MSDLGSRAISLLGFATMIALAWSLSSNRREVPWRTVAWGVGLQLGLALLLLKSQPVVELQLHAHQIQLAAHAKGNTAPIANEILFKGKAMT